MRAVQTTSRKGLVVKIMTESFIEKLFSRFHHKRVYLNYFLAGFADGEGSFSVAVIRHPMQKFGWMLNPVFQVYQHEKHREILELFQWAFQTGRIYRKSGIHPVLNFSIDSRRSLIERVIPFFSKYPLIVKSENFKKFKTIVQAMDQKKHHTKNGLKHMIALAYTMNQQGKGRKHPIEYIYSIIEQQDNRTTRNPQRPTSES